ncbi:alpha/beta hydrolase family protein [Seonamhaeicola marinus]|nr:lipase family protein [Seonamhaeicola marinus]
MSTLLACSNDDTSTISNPIINVNPSSSERGALISYQEKGHLTTGEIASNGANIGNVSTLTTHDIKAYKVIYNSLYAGELTKVSGLVFVPQNTLGALRIIQHHHGTIIPSADSKAEVPSNYNGSSTDDDIETSFIGAVMASNGYVVSLPDYVGYGETAHLEHPYTVHHELAEVSVDMIRATKNLLNALSVDFSKNVFLTGWSEGGGAGLATHKYLQLNYPKEFNIKASSLFAGPYDYFLFTSDILANNDENLDNLDIYNWSIYSVNKFTPSLSLTKETIWSYTVENQTQALNIPSYKPNNIYQPEILNPFHPEYIRLTNLASNNSLINGWTPTGNLFFHSGTDDEIVPHYNSTNAHKQFELVGANSKLYEYPGEDHYTPLYNYVKTTIQDFNSIQ